MTKPSIRQNQAYLYKGVWVRGQEEEFTVDEQKQYDKASVIEGDVVLDIGAHIGCSAIYFMNRGAKAVHSFEPILDNYRVLERNAIDKNIIPYRMAIVDTYAEYITLYTPNSRFTTEHSVINKRGRIPVQVPAQNFSLVLERIKPQVLKVDIEGAEMYLFKGFEIAHQYVRSIAMEVHYYEEDSRIKGRQLKDMLSIDYNEVRPMRYLNGGWNHCIAIWEHK